jgi:hypothetical protein
MPTSHGGGGNPFSWAWNHIVKPAAKFAYHASGAADVVGCVTHPSWGGCARAVGAIALTVATMGDGTLLRMAVEGGASLALRDLATQAATRAAESWGAVGRGIWYGYKTAGRVLDDTVGRYVNPELTYGWEAKTVYSNGHPVFTYPSPLTMRPFEGMGETLKTAYESLPAEGEETLWHVAVLSHLPGG